MTKIAIIVETILILLLSAALAWSLFRHPGGGTVPAVLLSESLPEQPTQPDKTYYALSGERIIMNDPVLGEIWLPVLADVPACTRSVSDLRQRNGMQCYVENGTVASHFGVDVSSHQEEIDWETVKASGVEFAMIRAGYRGYGSGELVEDPYFKHNVQGALAAGIRVGVYFYSQAITPEEAVEEAQMTLELIGDYDITYPVVYDWETVSEGAARTDHMPIDDLTACCKAFCDTVQAAGYVPMIYQNMRTSMLKLERPELTDYDFWLAEYHDEPLYYYDYQIWQYASDGHVPGIPGEVDVNISFRDYAKRDTE